MDSRVVSFYDKDYHLLGIDDDAEVIYTNAWNTYNSFEIYLKEMKDFVKEGNRIIFDGDGRKNGVITYVKCNDIEDTVTIKGYSLTWMLSHRLTVPASGKDQIELTGPVEDVMYELVRLNAINSPKTARNFPRLEVAPSQHRGERITFRTRYDNLLSNLVDLSRYSMAGIGVNIIPEEGREIFEVMWGVNRSINQSDNSQVVFRMDYDNITSEIYEINTADYKNCAYTAGQGDGAARRVYIVGDSAQGEDRRELFVDARDIENDAELPQRGQEKLAGYKKSESFEVVVDSKDYGTRWNIGDRVTVVSDTAGVTADFYITEVQETLDVTGHQVIPTFGDKTATIGETAAAAGSGSSGASSGSGGGGGEVTKDAIVKALGFIPVSPAMVDEIIDEDVPFNDIAANTSARHAHSNKAILDGITKAPITDLSNYYTKGEVDELINGLNDVLGT